MNLSGLNSAALLPPTPHPANRARASRDGEGISAIEAIDDVLDLSDGQRDIFGMIQSLKDSGELDAFLSILSGLLQQGIVGTETLEVNGEPYTSFVDTRIADERLRDAEYYRERNIQPRIDYRA